MTRPTTEGFGDGLLSYRTTHSFQGTEPKYWNVSLARQLYRIPSDHEKGSPIHWRMREWP